MPADHSLHESLSIEKVSQPNEQLGTQKEALESYNCSNERKVSAGDCWRPTTTVTGVSVVASNLVQYASCCRSFECLKQANTGLILILAFKCLAKPFNEKGSDLATTSKVRVPR